MPPVSRCRSLEHGGGEGLDSGVPEDRALRARRTKQRGADVGFLRRVSVAYTTSSGGRRESRHRFCRWPCNRPALAVGSSKHRVMRSARQSRGPSMLPSCVRAAGIYKLAGRRALFRKVAGAGARGDAKKVGRRSTSGAPPSPEARGEGARPDSRVRHPVGVAATVSRLTSPRRVAPASLDRGAV